MNHQKIRKNSHRKMEILQLLVTNKTRKKIKRSMNLRTVKDKKKDHQIKEDKKMMMNNKQGQSLRKKNQMLTQNK